MAVRTAKSCVLLQDGSPAAADVLQNFLASPHHLSIQLGDMLSLLQETGDFPDFRRGLNEESSVVVMVFSSVNVVRKFVEAKTVSWITCPLLLLSLSLEEDSRYSFNITDITQDFKVYFLKRISDMSYRYDFA